MGLPSCLNIASHPNDHGEKCGGRAQELGLRIGEDMDLFATKSSSNIKGTLMQREDPGIERAIFNHLVQYFISVKN